MAGHIENDDLRTLECSICMNYPRSATESNCCAQLICKACVDDLNRNSISEISCPLCRRNFGTSYVKGTLKRLIDNINIECENGCGSIVKLGNLGDHEMLCEKASVTCKFCRELINTKLFIDHLTSVHSTDLVKSCSTTSNKSSADLDLATRNSHASGGCVNLFKPKTNLYGNNAKLGESGKFYCGNPLQFACPCCNGRCGPNNGCNCVGCQQLDIQARNLPRGVYVNSEGCVSFRHTLQKSFYCLRTSSSERGRQFVCDINRNLCRSCRGLNTAWNACAAFRNLNC